LRLFAFTALALAYQWFPDCWNLEGLQGDT